MLLAKNRKALFNYEVIEKYIAGIVLKGYEVKAVRDKNVSFEGSYITVENGVAYLVGLHIGRYKHQSQEISNTQRKRALLLNKREIEKIDRAIHEKGKTAVPLALVLQNNLVKLELAVVKGRKEFEKKVVAKEREQKRELEILSKELGV